MSNALSGWMARETSLSLSTNYVWRLPNSINQSIPPRLAWLENRQLPTHAINLLNNSAIAGRCCSSYNYYTYGARWASDCRHHCLTIDWQGNKWSQIVRPWQYQSLPAKPLYNQWRRMMYTNKCSSSSKSIVVVAAAGTGGGGRGG